MRTIVNKILKNKSSSSIKEFERYSTFRSLTNRFKKTLKHTDLRIRTTISKNQFLKNINKQPSIFDSKNVIHIKKAQNDLKRTQKQQKYQLTNL